MPPPSRLLQRAAPAKVNLGLHVLRRRPDGYHDVETVLLPIGWHDTLTAGLTEPGAPFRFTCSDPALPTDERNLCVRAAHALAAEAGIEPYGTLHLDKHVPYGAGLGGGSSDAAVTLRLMAELWDVAPSAEELHDLAAALGSDVPFFLHDGPMRATGRGDVLRPLDAEYHFPFALAVVMPPVRVGTAGAYRQVTPHADGRPDLGALVRSNDLARWRRGLTNDFEAPVLARYPEVARVKADLTAAGAGYAALSGSGAAVFGVFEAVEEARAAAESATEEGLRAWWGRPGGGAG
ncbi:MAG: 4-(cytidine 5'-diphospho)-2-C-methyl-D-erythritol kinase [Rhodothermales bacterium]|nr:4-(cytidine 5'-diphospho)-2-C-methyl-D-erythritol kinase [Rhodothermales bacterium]